MTRTIADALRWIDEGTALVSTAVSGLTDDELAQPSVLPGWTRLHLLAHLAGNADALCNLVHWASTGEPTPMYSSPTRRNDDIEAGATKPAGELRAWFDRSAGTLSSALAALAGEAWDRSVVTGQGRTVPATDIPWLRVREVMVHSTDLGAGIGFDDLPTDFLHALVDDIAAKRGSGEGPALVVRELAGSEWQIAGDGEAVAVQGPLPQLAAYLAGRPWTDVTAEDGSSAPELPRWL
jgi:maleylpyruvate isomerase